MAEFGISLAEQLVEVLASEPIKVVCEMWNYKKELEELKETVSTIHSVLLDADAKRDLTHEQQHYINKLKDAVYDADDLFDEFLSLADELKELGPLSKRRKFYEKVRRFFSSSKNEVAVAYRMSRDIKEIKERLGHIADNHQKFGFSVDYKPIIRRREETCSYIDANDIIGRDEDKEAIVDMLLNNPNNNNEHISFVTIVGVGGLGKTTLSQLVYNDERIKKEFEHNLRLWVCVSDQEGEPFDVKTILSKILELLDGHKKFDSNATMELVQHKFQQKLRRMKYFLVLDDIWNEDREKWLHLKKFLMMGQGGSRVVVTTRSKWTGTVIDEKHAYELEGLSQENSWLLFEMSAFDKGDQKLENHQEFVEIGKKIVKKCSNNPLAIKVVGSLLFGQRISKWKSVEDSGLAEINNDGDKILSILKLSYHNLSSSLKNCFSYCAVFQKDFRIEKQNLIDLWIAQGFITLLDGGQDIEDAAEEHFLILLRRCFFQDRNKNYRNADTFKIHDLMHDVAQEAGKDEMCVVTSVANSLGDKIRHVQYVGDNSLMMPLGSSKIRSIFFSRNRYMYGENFVIDSQLDNWICLRVLDVSCMGLKMLPKSIGKLLHLRYLNLSDNSNLEVLPGEITRLHNLQTLLLYWCQRLRELPADFSKLVKLRHLDLRNCGQLRCMPLGMDKLTSLKVLPYVCVGQHQHDGITTSDGLNFLKALTGIRGEMRINIGGYYRPQQGMNESGGLGGYLENIKHLSKVSIKFEFNGRRDNPEAVFDHLEPPSYVNELLIWDYEGTTIPRWGRAVENWAISFSHLVYINLFNCTNLEEMPALSKLPHLKSLFLHSLKKLEYMEMDITSNASDTKLGGLEKLFFPSLEKLQISGMQMLKGWWKENSRGVDDDHRLTFACLSELMIYDCPNLTSFVICPRLKRLELRKINESLKVIVNSSEKGMAGNSSQGDVKLQELMIDNMGHLNSLPIKCLTTLKISGNHKVGGIVQVGELESIHVSEVFASSLGTLAVGRMNTLRTLCGATGLQSFTALKHLSLGNIPVRRQIDHYLLAGGAGGEEEGDEENEFDASSFPPNLLRLEFNHLKKMKSLPSRVQYLASLQDLQIDSCGELEALPEWMSCLSSLKFLRLDNCPALQSLPQAMQNLTSIQRLYIYDCPKLKQRCKEPDGEDRPKIQHIPDIRIGW